MPGGVNNIDGINRTNFGGAPSVPEQNPSVETNQTPTPSVPVEDLNSVPRDDFKSPSEMPKKSHKGIIVLAVLLILVGAFAIIFSIFGEQILGLNKVEPTPVIDPTPEPEPISKDYGKELNMSFLKVEQDKKNVIYSPLSIKYALNLLDEGASGETKTQIKEVLGNTELTGYQNVEDKLSLANSVFIKNDFKEFVLPNYIDTVTEKYDAEILFSDFADASEIDSWIDQKTFGLIKNSGVKIGPDTVMALVNALAIQLDWKLKFEAESTSGRDFNYADGTKDEVTMMTRSFTGDGARLYDSDGVKAVAMDLEEVAGTGLEFVAIMPEEDLDGYVEELDEKALDTILDGLVAVDEYSSAPKDAQTVKPIEKLDYLVVDIPKFKFDYELEEFGKKLENLGIKDAFNAKKADFSGISEEEKLYVSQAIHKANIDFSEDGIKAAAITIFVVSETTAIAEPDDDQPVVKTITFDKPFMFVVRDKNTGEKWFVGTVYEPNKWADDKSEYQG